jgi:xanthine dehydrogenase accessory factor
MKALAKRIGELLEAGEPVATATVLNREGSAPRSAGSKMIVDRAGKSTGTIGGGRFEADVTAAAVEVLASGRPREMTFDLHGEALSEMDMICGGRMTVFVDFVPPAAEPIEVFQAWREALKVGRRCLLVTRIDADGTGEGRLRHCLLQEDGSIVGTWPVSGVSSESISARGFGAVARVVETGKGRLLVEPTTEPQSLLLFGAGHVSQPTAGLAAAVGFRVTVADDRDAFANRERFPTADDIRVLTSFDSALNGVAVGEDTFIVIVTRGHRHDRTVLSQALRTPAGYVGMIGSRRKKDAIYGALLREGFTESDLARVHCPIGLSIGAETPEEIAVSIVAELIAYRAGHLP